MTELRLAQHILAGLTSEEFPVKDRADDAVRTIAEREPTARH